MVSQLIFDEIRTDRRAAPVIAGVLLLLAVLAYFERGHSVASALLVPLTLVSFFSAVVVLSDCVLRIVGRGRLGWPWIGLTLLVTAHSIYLGMEDRDAVVALLGSALACSIVMLAYGKYRRL